MPAAIRSCRVRVAALCLALWSSLAIAAPQALAVLPPLPLPDCVANGLPMDDGEAVCEGAKGGPFPGLPQIPPVPNGAVALGITTRSVDFRRDEDRAGSPQLVTFAWNLPEEWQGTEGSVTYRAAAIPGGWPQYLEDDINVDRRGDGDMFWFGDSGGAPFGMSEHPGRALFERVGECAAGARSCTYRVRWDAYPHVAVFEDLIYRVCLEWRIEYVREFNDGTFDPACGNDPTNGCTGGGGAACTTFKTDPPPRPKAVAKSTRIGSKQFAFDASDSTDPALIEEYHWILLSNTAKVQHVFQKTFEHDYHDDDLPSFVSGDVPSLLIRDHYKRTASTTVLAEFLAGVEGFLEIVSFDLVGIENGVATLKAVVKNTDATKTVTNAFLERLRFPAGQVQSTPTATEIEPGESVEFTVTTAVDTTDPISVEITALGNVDTGPVKSASARERLNDSSGPGDADTETSAAANPDDDHVDVDDTGAFKPGDYAGIDPGPNSEVRRVRRVARPRSVARAASPGTLVFDAPLANGHAAGVGVYKIDPPADDTDGPSIAVTSPLPGQIVCAGAPLTAELLCEDQGIGVERCGDGIGSGQALDTASFGPQQDVVRAWDFNGNVSEQPITWTVSFCDAAIDSFHCYAAKPGGGTKFAPIAGVRASGPVDDVLVDLKKPLQLCVPADTSGDGVGDEDVHLESYVAKLQKGQPKVAPQAGVRLASQLGTLTVDTGKLTSLLLPTAQDPTTPPAPISNPDLDRFACHAAKLAKGTPKLPKDLQITVVDDLAPTPLRYSVKKLTSLCVPVTPDGGAPKHGDRLLCFKTARTKGRCTDSAPANAGGGCKKEPDCGGIKGETSFCAIQPKFASTRELRVANDLDGGTLDTHKDDVVCLPAVVTP